MSAKPSAADWDLALELPVAVSVYQCAVATAVCPPLFAAVYRRERAQVAALLQDPATDPNVVVTAELEYEQGEVGLTALHAAVLTGDTDITHLLLGCERVDRDAVGKGLAAPLVLALCCSIPRLQAFLGAPAGVSPDGSVPRPGWQVGIHNDSAPGDQSPRVNPILLVVEGYTHARLAHDEQCIHTLLEAGADPNLVLDASTGTTLLHAVCRSPRVTPSVLRLLLAHGADSSARDSEGRRPSDCLAPGDLNLACALTLVFKTTHSGLTDAEAAPDYSTLPELALRVILDHLPADTINGPLPLVCKAFRIAAARMPELACGSGELAALLAARASALDRDDLLGLVRVKLLNPHGHGPGLSPEGLQALSRRCPHLAALECYGSPVVAELPNALPNLCRLRLHHDGSPGILAVSSLLTHLQLGKRESGDFEDAFELPNVESLHLEVGSSHLVSRFLQACPKLKSLKLNHDAAGAGAGDYDWLDDFPSGMPPPGPLPHLRCLEVYNDNGATPYPRFVDSEAHATICTIIAAAPGLQRLHLSSTELNDDVFEQLRTRGGLAQLRTLVLCLDMCEASGGDTRPEKLFGAPLADACPHLESFQLQGVTLEEAPLDGLIALVRGCRSLTWLWLLYRQPLDMDEEDEKLAEKLAEELAESIPAALRREREGIQVSFYME